MPGRSFAAFACYFLVIRMEGIARAKNSREEPVPEINAGFIEYDTGRRSDSGLISVIPLNSRRNPALFMNVSAAIADSLLRHRSVAKNLSAAN